MQLFSKNKKIAAFQAFVTLLKHKIIHVLYKLTLQTSTVDNLCFTTFTPISSEVAWHYSSKELFLNLRAFLDVHKNYFLSL